MIYPKAVSDNIDKGNGLFSLGCETSSKKLRDGEPCSHPGCLSHRSHPCEGCGRTGGVTPIHLVVGAGNPGAITLATIIHDLPNGPSVLAALNRRGVTGLKLYNQFKKEASMASFLEWVALEYISDLLSRL